MEPLSSSQGRAVVADFGESRFLTNLCDQVMKRNCVDNSFIGTEHDKAAGKPALDGTRGVHPVHKVLGKGGKLGLGRFATSSG